MSSFTTTSTAFLSFSTPSRFSN
ncbi:hypothetical protein BC936DRAFT_136970 [Jimgerdemannia flammicorona]|uniref:Uncharacterized protein n=1 Tax=Jimgerdemannia flammicorona TaxID=994334 RepID=A0A433CYE8_9FUNG|nr:hypothetical protein BC936DRAFT_136970 [Jimgerdemannia flammicorona]